MDSRLALCCNAGMANVATANAAAPGSGSAAATPSWSPLYRQIKSLLLAAMRDGDWGPGDAIPSETELAARFGVSQGTVRKAVDELAAEHVVLRRQGKGTYVASHDEPRVNFRFLRLRPDDGPGSASRSQILECRRVRAPAGVARPLNLRSGEGVVLIRRVLSFDDEPTVLDEIWLPGALFRGLTPERLAADTGSLYGLFEAGFGVRMVRCREQIRATAADAATAAALAVAEGTPLLQVDRLSLSYDDRPVEVRRGWYLTRSHHYENELG